MEKTERISFLILFCALILVKNDAATMDESMAMVPFFGRARLLAGELSSPVSA
jgi:hypothetical protein